MVSSSDTYSVVKGCILSEYVRRVECRLSGRNPMVTGSYRHTHQQQRNHLMLPHSSFWKT